MNIAFFSKHLPSDRPNGVSVQVDRLACALVARGHSVTCFSFSPRPDNAPYAVTQLSMNTRSRFLQKILPAIAFNKTGRKDFDICHFHGDDYLCAGSPQRIRTFYGSALYEAFHAKTAGRFLYQALFYLFEWASCRRRGTLVAISRATQKALPIVPHTIPCGVPLDKYTSVPAMKTDSPSLLFVGDFKSRKRGDFLLRVFKDEVLRAHPACRLTIVGPEKIEAPNVSCLGRISESELINEYRKAWIYCLPSSYEGFGVPAIEAMACGTAVIATQNAGVREIITPGENGVICKVKDLGKSIIAMIENHTARGKFIENGLKKVKDFDIKRVAEQYENLYKKAVRPADTLTRKTA
jgi:phosphatidyl-myo-inositol alpha-mannosyltransferase